ncbi:MAG: hypothetical protein JXR81_07875 [Candidatus Goldbacteria bacterium]|nr:hypothetical protein [Candidatus Goldiibacteriota bacterium]
MKVKLFTAIFFMLNTAAFCGISGLPVEVINHGAGVRALSMGGAASADSADPSASFWSPAMLDSITSNQLEASHEMLYGGAAFNALGFSGPIGKMGGLGVSIRNMYYGEYEVVSEEGNVQGNEVMNDFMLTGAYGRNLFAGVQGGLALKAIVRGIGGKNYMGFNSDVSFSKSFEWGRASLTGKNVIPAGIKYDFSEEMLPAAVRLGLSFMFLDGTLKVNTDAEKAFAGGPFVVCAGAEYKVMQPLYLRAGAASIGDVNEINAGFGFKHEGFGIDYGAAYTELSLNHRVALSYSFGGYELKLAPEPAVFSPIGGNRKTYIKVTAMTKYEIFKWKVEIKDNKGKVVKSWEGAGRPDETLIWDGLDRDGMPFNEGDYKAVIVVTDENDAVSRSADVVIKISQGDQKAIPLFME